MTARTRLPLIALLASSLAVSFPPAAAADAPVASAQAGLKNARKLKKVLRKKGLAKLPSVAGALASHGKRHKRGMAAVVTGTPPTLLGIPDQSIKDVFWRPGVVDAIAGGSPNQEQCGEFWSGSQDGQSGGMGACRMAENVGVSLGEILGGDTSLCYMKRFPTRANLNAGALTLLAGEFPNGDPTRLFSVPEGSASRVVKVNVSGEPEGSQTVYLRVHGEDENTAAGDLYAVDLWFCRGGDATTGFNTIRITESGEFTSDERQTEEDGSHIATVSGNVTFTNGEVVFDTSRPRRAQLSSVADWGSFKADNEIAGDNTIASRSYNVWAGSPGSGTRKSYVVASFSGSTIDSLRFLAGAFKERQSSVNDPQRPDYVGSTEYRSTYYAASPGSALETRLADVSFDSDAFYAAPPSVSVDTSGYTCAVTPDVELALDFATPKGQEIRGHCERRNYERMRFCSEDPTVREAEMNIGPACYGPH